MVGNLSKEKKKRTRLIEISLGTQPPPFAKITIRRVMSQGVACPNGRPLHSETPAVVDFGPSFTDLSRGGEIESDKEVAKINVELLGRTNFRF